MSQDLNMGEMEMGKPVLKSYDLKAIYASMKDGIGVLTKAAEEKVLHPEMAEQLDVAIWDLIGRFNLGS